MMHDELKKIAARLYGDQPGWQAKLADDLGVAQSTVSRWVRGEIRIPHPVALAVRALERRE